MSDRAALLAAICADPDEDTPRLMYADWLDEHGGAAGAKRAAYIRGEVADYRAAQADAVTSTLADFFDEHEEIDWSAVDADLGARVAAQKAADKRRVKLTAKGEGVSGFKGVKFVGPERGFYSCAWVEDTAAFLRQADAIFRAAPVVELVAGLNADQAADLVRSGHLARVRELELRPPVDAEALRVLGASRDASGVRKLEVPLGQGGAAILGALAAGQFWTGVERLHATGFRNDDQATSGDAVTEMLAARPFPNLHALHMWASRVNDDGARLIARTLPGLRFLDLAINDITGPGAAALAASKSLPHLRHLDLAVCHPDADTGSVPFTSLIVTKNLPNLAVLKIDGNHLRMPAKVLTRACRAPTLRALVLNTTSFTPETLESLAKCPAVRNLWHLDMYIGDIGDEHLERFLRHAPFERLTTLDLSNNDLTARGARALAAWPGAASLQWLDLSNNGIGESGAKALANSPYLSGVKCFRFNGRGTATLKKRFKKAFDS